MNISLNIAVKLLFFFSFAAFASNVFAQERIYVHTNKDEYISSEAIQYKAYLFGRDKDGPSSKIMYFQLTGSDRVELSGLRANVENGACNGEIVLPNTLASGYYLLSVYTNCMRNYPLQTCFNKKILIINQNDSKLDSVPDFTIKETLHGQSSYVRKKQSNQIVCKLVTDKNTFKPREKVNLKLQLSNLPGVADLTNLSVSVTEQSQLEDTTQINDVVSYSVAMNDEWDDLKARNHHNSKRHFTENKGFIFNGCVASKTNKTPLAGVTVLLSSPDSIANLQYYNTNKSGSFYFLLNPYYDNRTVYYQLRDSSSKRSDYEFRIDDKRISPTVSATSIRTYDPLVKKYIETSQKIALINNVYKSKLEAVNSESVKDATKHLYPFYGIPDQTVIPANFEELPSFVEINRNIIFGVSLEKKKDKLKLTMVDSEFKVMQDENALLLINTIPVFNYSVLEPLNTTSIRKIELKRNHILYGDLNLYGVMSVFVKDKLASDIFTELEIPTFQNKVMKGNIASAQLQSDDYKKGPLPDFRQSLYWNPEVKLDKDKAANIGFYTSDLKARYVIQVQGITSDQTPVYARYSIEVK